MNDSTGSTATELDRPATGPETGEGDLPRDVPKLIMLAVLHMAKFFPAAFSGVALTAILRQKGLPLKSFWLLAIPGYPSWIKFLIALVVDNYGNQRIGFRKTWIIPCTLTGTCLYAVLAFIPPSLEAVYGIVAILFVKSFVMAAQDVAVDAYAVENMNDRERPLGTSLIMFLAVTAGVLGMGVVALVDIYGWKPTMLTSALLLTGFALPAIIRKEPPPPEARQKRMDRGERPSLIKLMKRKDSWYIMPYIFGFGFAEAFFRSMLLPFLVDKGVTLTQMGILLPISALSGNGMAAILTPILINRIGLKRTALIGLCGIPVEAIVFCNFALMPQLPPLPIFISIVAAMVFVVSLYSITVNNSRFRWASKTQSGTDYSLQGSVWHFGGSAAASTAGFVAGAAGWPAFFIISGTIGITVAISYILMFDRVEDLVLRREERELEG